MLALEINRGEEGNEKNIDIFSKPISDGVNGKRFSDVAQLQLRFCF